MPDWSYQTIFQPILFRLPYPIGRDLALKAMGRLARLPLGSRIIDFLGHMRPDSRLRRTRLGINFPTAIGLGVGIDPGAMATPALARFGFGFLELGPVTLGPRVKSGPIVRRVDSEEIELDAISDSVGAIALAERLRRDGPLRVPILARLAPTPGISPDEAVRECREMAERLAPHASAFSLLLTNRYDWQEIINTVRSAAPNRPILLVLPADLDSESIESCVEMLLDGGPDGFLVDGALRSDSDRRIMGKRTREPARNLVKRLRTLHPQAVLIASGGIHEPIDALNLLIDGADLIQIDSGLVFTGPGLPKRVNDAVLALEHGRAVSVDHSPALSTKMTWFWALLMGLGMLIGSVMALAIAYTRVVLPYDESFVGMTRVQLDSINPHLLDFMTHDRVTLAGVMITLGVLYCGLSYYGIRKGLYWAMVTVLSSASVGFLSFFSFLGFGYLDPMHAFVTVVLLQFLLMAFHCNLGMEEVPKDPSLFNDRAWKMSLWGQLLILIQAALFFMAGTVISIVGVTRVFVPEDLAFMHISAKEIAAANPRLIPLIAHDRATMGGMLLCAGLAYLMPALWGFRRNSRWLWWTMAIASVPGFLATSIVHMTVGYHDMKHLTPVLVGASLIACGLALCYRYLVSPDRETEEAWARLRERLNSIHNRNP